MCAEHPSEKHAKMFRAHSHSKGLITNSSIAPLTYNRLLGFRFRGLG